MRYQQFRAAIHQYLESHREGAPWLELKRVLKMPYERPCPEWTRRLEQEIGLTRRKGSGRALIWSLQD
jgi:hypothetical protein